MKNNIIAITILIAIITSTLVGLMILQNKNKCFITTDSQKQLNKMINILIRQTARWSTAAAQDESPLIAVLHANYGAGFLWALKDIASDTQIEQATNLDIVKFEREVVKIQDNATKRMIKLCPKYAPPKTYLTKYSGEGL